MPNHGALTVVEIIRRLEQGVTRPFLVRAEDGTLYVAKGLETTRRGLMAEWLCAHLARELDVNIPDFTLLDVPPELAGAFGPEGAALGVGLVFGSLCEAGVQEFAITQLKHIDADARRKLLIFDWWVENADRSLTPHGGNPNLLWRAAQSRLIAIDHNLAFDDKFDEAGFFETHVFREDAAAVFDDLIGKAETSALLEKALGCFDATVASLPPAWYWVDVEQTVRVEVDLAAIKARLAARTALNRGSQP